MHITNHHIAQLILFLCVIQNRLKKCKNPFNALLTKIISDLIIMVDTTERTKKNIKRTST